VRQRVHILLTHILKKIGEPKPTSMYNRTPSHQAITPQSSNLPMDTWTAVVDKNSGGTYYWNQLTNETTQVIHGLDCYYPWLELSIHGLDCFLRVIRISRIIIMHHVAFYMHVYCHVSRLFSERYRLLQVGEPKPTSMYRPSAYQMQPQPSFGSAIGSMFLWGAGMTIGFAFVGALFRMLFG
jgi:hypothetical protein